MRSREDAALVPFAKWEPAVTASLVTREHVGDFLISQSDLDDGLPLVLERRVVVVDVGGQEELGVPGEALAGGEVRDLSKPNVSHVIDQWWFRLWHVNLTSRGGPSGSPMLMTVDSDLEMAEPGMTQVSYRDMISGIGRGCVPATGWTPERTQEAGSSLVHHLLLLSRGRRPSRC